MSVQHDLCEKQPMKIAIVFYTLTVLIVMHLWYPSLSPLSSVEAFHALTAGDLISGNATMHLTGSDGYMAKYPFYSMVLSQLGRLFPLNEYVCRLPNLLAVLGMTLMVAYTAARASGHRAGLTAASVVMVSFGVGLNNVGGNALLGAFLISSGWIFWYRSSRLWNLSWFLVWLLALLPVFTAIWAIGFKALFIFYLPLLLMRRPLKARKRLIQIHHIIILTFYIVLFLLLKQGIFGDGLVIEIQAAPEQGLFNFLGLALLFSFPWCCVGWPIFCMAFQGIEKTPVLDQFLRTILISVFILALLFIRDISILAILMPIFAIATGIHYDIFMRRHYLQVRYVGRILIIGMSGVLTWSIILIALVYFNVSSFSHLQLSETLIAGVICLIALLIALLLFLMKKKFMIYSCRITIITACFIISGFTAQQVFTKEFDYKKTAAKLSEKIESYSIIYLLTERPCYREAYYLNRKVATVKTAEKLPETEIVYVLTSGDAPILETREWTQVAIAEFPNGKLAMWHGKKRPELTTKQ